MPEGFQFGAFELDLSARELRKRGIKIRLGDQSIEFLIALLERPGEIVSREQIRDRLWPDGITVDFEHSINSAAKRLRDALGDSSATPRFIETLPRRGYRFVGNPTPIRSAPPAAPELPPRKAYIRRGWLWAGAIASVLVLAAAVGAWKLPLRDRAETPRISSIAVLPLANLSGDPEQQYLADGLTEELITELVQIRTLSVISRTSVSRYKDAKKSAREIGRELNVDAILEGSLARSGSRVRITTQLIHCPSDHHFWARRFDRDLQDTLNVQEDIARAVASEVRGNLTAADATVLRAANPRAHEAWLRALFFLNAPRAEYVPKGVEYLEQAVRLDPGYALAWARLAHIRAERDFYQDLPPSESFLIPLRKSNELGQSLAEAHMVNGDYEFFWKWNFAKGEAEFRRAAELNPGAAPVREHLAYCYWMLDRKPEALTEAERARELDPSSFQANVILAELLMVMGQHERAIRQFERTSALDPAAARPYLGLARVYRNMGNSGEAATNLLKCARLEGHAAELIAALDTAFRSGGVEALWRAFHRLRAERLQKRALKQRVSPLKLAEEYAGAGEKELALAWLNRAYSERCPNLPWIGELVAFAGMRSDPRFQEFVERMKVRTE